MVHRCTLDATGQPDPAARQAYARDGVLVIERFAPAATCEALRGAAGALLAQFGPAAPHSVFSTADQGHARDRAFEASANGIGVFFEEGALDAQGQLRVALSRAVNKIGHALHEHDPVCRNFCSGPRLQALVQGLGLADPRLIQSMFIFKPPGLGGEVACHQDETFIATDPPSTVGLWLAIDDAHLQNGCLGGLPGWHRRGLRQRFARQADGQLALRTLAPELAWPLHDIEWLEAPQGTLIVFDGAFPHLSRANRSADARLAFTLHLVSAGAHYLPDNWIQRQPGLDPPWRGFLPDAADTGMPGDAD